MSPSPPSPSPKSAWLQPPKSPSPAVSAWLSNLDATAFLAALQPGSVDLLVTDPAYESLEKHRAHGTTTRLSHSSASSNDWFEIFKNERFPAFFASAFQALASNAHLYVYCDLDTAKIIDPIGEAAGFTCWNWIVWDKRKIGMGYHYRRRKEFILFFEKGKRKLHNLGTPDVIDADVLWGVDLISEDRVRGTGSYPTEKPVRVTEVLIEQSSSPGQLVCDPFMGSGSTGEACWNRRRSFLGNDLSSASVQLVQKRLASLR